MKESITLRKDPTLNDLQAIGRAIYGIPNDRFFNIWDLFSNQEKFMMRALKGIRKKDIKKIKYNLMITTGWFIAILNKIHINLDEILWDRFPYLCSYCGNVPCKCKKIKPKNRPKSLKITRDMPKSLAEWQKMFNTIYPANSRSLEQSGIHLAEENGELSEAIQVYFGTHSQKYFHNLTDEAADYFSCLLGVFNSAGIDFEDAMSEFYSNNCHICQKAPCECNFRFISEFKS